MPKFSVWYELPSYYEVEVEASSESAAEAKADAIITNAMSLDPFYSSQGELELHLIENHSERSKSTIG